MRRVRMIWSPEAKRALQSIQRYIARGAPRTAAAFVKKLKKAAERLREFPESGGTVPELEPLDYREIVFGNYRILYRYTGRTVEIVAVQHAAKPLDPEFFIE